MDALTESGWTADLRSLMNNARIVIYRGITTVGLGTPRYLSSKRVALSKIGDVEGSDSEMWARLVLWFRDMRVPSP